MSGIERRYYLLFPGDSTETGECHRTKADAAASFAETARELARYDQRIEASIHIGSKSRSTLSDYPDFALSLGPRGGIRCERC